MLLQSALILSKLYKNAPTKCFHLISQPVAISWDSSKFRQYAISTEREQPSVGQRLKNMEENIRRGQFVSKDHVLGLLQAINEQTIPSLQYVQTFQFFGEVMSEETPAYRLKLARKLWHSLELKSIVNIAHINALLGVYVQNEHSFLMDDILDAIKVRNLRPNRETFEQILDNYSRVGDLESVEKTMATMKTYRIRMNEKMFNLLILAHGVAGKKREALEFQEKMVNAGIQPSRATHVAILRVSAMCGDLPFILSEIERLTSEEIRLQDKDILQMIYDLAVNGFGESGKQLFPLLLKKNYYSRLASNTINRLIQKNQDHVAYDLYKTLPIQQMTFEENVSNGDFPVRDIVTIMQRFEGSQKQRLSSMTSLDLTQRIAEQKSENQIATQIELAKAYHLESQIDKLEELLCELETKSASLPFSIYARLIESKLQAKDLSAAVAIFDKCKQYRKDFYLSHETVMKAVLLFIDCGKFEDALMFLAKNKRNHALREDDRVTASCLSVLSRLAEEGKEVEVKQLFNTLVLHGHMLVNSKLINPLLKVHLVNSNTQKAIEALEYLTVKYKFMPYNFELYNHLVKTEDWSALNKIVDVCSAVRDNGSGLIDLAVFYIECGDTKRAQEIFDMPNLFLSLYHIENICKNQNIASSIDCLKNLIEATTNQAQVRREPFFLHLLKLYINEDQLEKAADLWIQIQDHNEVAGDEFLIRLGAYLKSKNVHIPFEIPHNHGEIIEAAERGTIIRTSSLDQLAKEFMKQLEQCYSAQIIQTYRRLSEAQLVAVINEISGKTKLVHLFNVLASNGDLDAIDRVNSLLPQVKKNSLLYENSYAKACGYSGQSENWIERWKEKLNRANSNDKELHKLDKDFPIIGFSSILAQNPELLCQCECLARNYAEMKATRPMQVIWCHYFLNGRRDIAKDIWTLHIQNHSYIDYRRITNKAIFESDLRLAHDLLEYLETSDSGKDNMNGAYHCLLRIYVHKGQFDDALKIVKKLRARSMYINPTVLAQIKAGLDSKGKKSIAKTRRK